MANGSQDESKIKVRIGSSGTHSVDAEEVLLSETGQRQIRRMVETMATAPRGAKRQPPADEGNGD